MNKKELEILKTTLTWADNYFTNYCELKGVYIYEQNEIDKIHNEEERHEAQDNRNFENLLFESRKILEKYI